MRANQLFCTQRLDTHLSNGLCAGNVLVTVGLTYIHTYTDSCLCGHCRLSHSLVCRRRRAPPARVSGCSQLEPYCIFSMAELCSDR